MNERCRERHARVVRIYCPVNPETLQALLVGKPDAMRADPVLEAMLAIIRDDNPLGDFGIYKGVVEIGFGFESFVPTAEAEPALGNADSVSVSPTVILTTFIAEGAEQAAVSAALDRLAAAHPWQVPVIEIGPVNLIVRR